VDYVKGDQQKALLELTMAPRLIQRPVIAPPDVPNERFLALRKALDATLEDPRFLEEAKTRKLDISLMRAGEIMTMVERLAKIPKEIRAQVADLLSKNN
jgi:tripartite-type tricarboxylate transporter receptor subunit TctC